MTLERHAFTLQLTERCNLACRYCYVRRRKNPDPVDCTTDCCERFVDFALRESQDKVKITFFGGEPLLRPDLIGHTVAYAKKAAVADMKKSIGFHLVTNGILLDDEMGDFLAGEGIGLEVSLDGPESVHDANRIYPDGSPTFRRVYGNLLRFVERHPDQPVSIFSVISSKESLPWLQAVCRGLDVQSFTFNPVRREHDVFSRDAKRALSSRIGLHKKAFLKGDVNVDEGISAQMACLWGDRETSRCEAGTNATIATRTGDIYPCPFFVGHEDQVIGNIAHGFYPDKTKPYIERHQASMKSCRKCAARRLCGSGCVFDSYEEAGRIDIPARHACTDTRRYVRSLEKSVIALAARQPEKLVEKIIVPLPERPSSTQDICRTVAPRSFVIRLTGRCNLACDYCYEKGKNLSRDDLDYPAGRKIIRQILEYPVASPVVSLFGGEPLLNWEVGKFIIEEIARESERIGKKPFFHLTTNGTLLTAEIAKTAARFGITVQISVDGRKEGHDRHRKHLNGRGSYQAMLRGVERLQRANSEARIDGQIVLTPGNLNMVDIAGYLKNLGFRRISFLIAGWEDRTALVWSSDDIKNLMKAREDFFPFFIDAALRGNADIDMGLASLVAAEPEGAKGLCECGTGEIYIDTKARIYRCPQLYAAGHSPFGRCGKPDQKKERDITAEKIISDDCLACWAYTRCRGGCMVRNQRCPWLPVKLTPVRELWCEFMKAEFARAMMAYRILEGRRPERIGELKAMFRG